MTPATRTTPTGEYCPGCNATDFRSLFHASDRLYGTTDKSFVVVECASCRLIRLYPWPDLEELKTYYPETYWFAPGGGVAASLEDLYRRLVLRDHVNFAETTLRAIPPGPVLDIGCGGALFGRLLRQRGFPCIGLDFSQQAATVGWKVNRVPVMVGDFMKPPFKPGSLACVTMYHVLEHLYDPGAALRSIRELLRPDGRLIIQVPNAACWQFVLLGEYWNGIDVPRHLVNFKDKDLDALLEFCGYEVLRHKYFSLRDNPAGLASSLVPWLDPMARRIRKQQESTPVRLLKDLAYLGIVAASVPLTVFEALCRAGSSVMIEARRRD